jgi:hypothetical protein
MKILKPNSSPAYQLTSYITQHPGTARRPVCAVQVAEYRSVKIAAIAAICLIKSADCV